MKIPALYTHSNREHQNNCVSMQASQNTQNEVLTPILPLKPFHY